MNNLNLYHESIAESEGHLLPSTVLGIKVSSKTITNYQFNPPEAEGGGGKSKGPRGKKKTEAGLRVCRNAEGKIKEEDN